MAYATLAVFLLLAIVVAVVTARLFPGLASWVLTWVLRFKGTIFGIIGLFSALYLLSSGVTILILIGFVGIVIFIWQVMFQNPFGWIRALI